MSRYNCPDIMKKKGNFKTEILKKKSLLINNNNMNNK